MTEIKTFEEALDKITLWAIKDSYAKKLLTEWELMKDADITISTKAYMQLRIIVYILNEGWMPSLDSREGQYYPLFEIDTKRNFDCRMEPYANSRCFQDYLLEHKVIQWNEADKNNYNIMYYYSPYFSLHSPNYFPVSYHTEEAAIYAGKQFIKLYAKYHLDKELAFVPYEYTAPRKS